MDLLLLNTALLFTRIDCCDVFNQLFGLSFWWHPFTEDDPLVNKACNATFLQICSHLGWPECEKYPGNFRFWVNYLQLSSFNILLHQHPLAGNKTDHMFKVTTLSMTKHSLHFSHLADALIQRDLQMRTTEAIKTNKRATTCKCNDKSRLA